MCEARAEFVAPAADRLVTDNDTALEQQFLNITQAKLEPEIPPNRETNDCRREPVAMIKRFSFLHRDILRDYLANVTVPKQVNHHRIFMLGVSINIDLYQFLIQINVFFLYIFLYDLFMFQLDPARTCLPADLLTAVNARERASQ
ncbi:hypothetical protein QF001_000586 [Paraburkholderia youngii]